MSANPDRHWIEWLEEGPDRGPVEGLERALAAVHRTSQRPGWSILERWIPMQLTMRRVVVPRAATLLATLALLLALALTLALVAGQQRRVPLPEGLADNGLIAYDADGVIYLADADGTNARVVEGGLGFDVSPTWSRDGRWVAFWSQESSNSFSARLYVASVDGGPARPLAEGWLWRGRVDWGPSWSYDSDAVYLTATDVVSAQSRIRIIRAPIDGSAATVIDDPDVESGTPWLPVVSPDGEWIAYRGDVNGGSRINVAVMRIDGTDEQVLATFDGPNDTAHSLWWSAASDRLLFHRPGEKGAEVVTMDLQGNERLISSPGEGGYDPSWSPDGRYIAYALETDGERKVILATADGSQHTDLGPVAGCVAGWSPDGRFLFGFVNGDCFVDRITKVPVDDPSAAEILTLPGDLTGFPSWQRVVGAER